MKIQYCYLFAFIEEENSECYAYALGRPKYCNGEITHSKSICYTFSRALVKLKIFI